MAGCEFHKEYFGYLGARITTELADVKSPDDRVWDKIWCVVLEIAICQSCRQITPEDASQLYQEIIGLYPQFEERLQEELEEKFGPREVAVNS